MNNKSRFMLLLLFFNGLLVVILLLSVRNQETRQRIQRIDREIKHQIEELATRRSNVIQFVYITATPLPSTEPAWTAVALVPTSTPQPAPTLSRPTETPRPRPNTPSPTLVPTARSTLTPTSTPTLTSTAVPTFTATPRPTQTPQPTWTPVPTAVSPITRISLTASDTTLPADGQSISRIRATLWNEAGQIYRPETAVTFSTDMGAFWGAPSVVALAIDGSVEAELTSSTSAGIAHIYAHADNLSANLQIVFEPGPPHSIGLSANPTRLNVQQTSVLLAVVRDQHQNPVSDGTNVQFDTTLGSLTPQQGLTQQGIVEVSLTSPDPGVARVTASSGLAARSLEIQFVSPLTILSITPSRECNQAPVQVTISGTGFGSGVSAHLGGWPLGVVSSSDDTLVAVVPGDIAAGIYDLLLSNLTGDRATLPNAYQALNCTSSDTTLDSGYLGTYGAEADFAAGQGDDDQLQVLFLQVPESTTQPLYVRLFDPDCGGQLDEMNGQTWDTTTSFSLYGATGAYTVPDARHSHPTTGASTGTLLESVTFGQDATQDGHWYNLRQVNPTEGEQVGHSRLFKLVIAGSPRTTPEVAAADLNLYNVALSTSSTQNLAPPGARIWAYSWTFLIPAGQATAPPNLYPYVGPNTHTLVQYNWDYDRHDENAGIQIITPVRTLQLGFDLVSGDNSLRFSNHAILDAEHNTTWAVRVWTDPGQVTNNLVTFWATDAGGQALPLFARSTTLAPPELIAAQR